MQTKNLGKSGIITLLSVLILFSAFPSPAFSQELTKSGVTVDEPPPPPKPKKPRPRKPRTDTLNTDQEKVYARAIEAAIWGMPIVSVYAMREAFFRDAGAQYGDVVYLSKFADWKFRVTTPNASTYYVYINYNTKDGPVVVDIPAAVGGGLFGSFENAWQTPLADIGPEGEDKGKGGKYLILPPGQEEKRKGYISVPSETYNGYAVFRVIPASSSEADRLKGMELVQKIHVYPLSKANGTKQTKYIDVSGRLFNGIVDFDETFYSKLTAMVNEEPILTRDLVAHAQLRSLGIVKGKIFNPDSTTRKILRRAIDDAHDDFMDDLADNQTPFWKGTHWGLDSSAGPSTGFTFLTKDGFYDIDGRALSFFFACAPPKKLGAASFYAAAFEDASGNSLNGSDMYTLHVPPNVPAKQYWSVVVYDLETAAFIKEAPVISLDSYNSNLKKNADGSVDIYFGPKAPEGKQSNWIYTKSGKRWCTLFRIYGPDQALHDRSWTMGDIKKMK